MLAIVT